MNRIPAPLALLLLLLLLLLFAIGCGGGASSPEEQLSGTWVSSTSTSGAGITFVGDGTYITQFLQLTASGSALDEMESGTFSVSGNKLNFAPQKSSCQGPIPLWSSTYTIAGSVLTLFGSGGLVSFNRDSSMPGGGVQIAFGCFSADGTTFTPSPLEPVGN
jgi:hypothetical protein